MNTMFKRMLSLLLLGAMLLFAVSCGGDAPTDTGSGDTTPEETTADPNFPAIEKCDYQNEEFHIAGPINNYGRLYFVEEQTGEVMDDAVFKRSQLVEEYLGIDITYEQLNGEGTTNGINLIPPLQAAAMAGEDAYQLVLTHSMNSIANLVTENLLMDWRDIPHIDFSKPYWNTDCNEALEVNGKQYYAFSDYMIVSAYGVYFNKTLVDQYKLENPYDLVRDNKWTIDKMTQMAAEATNDLNGDTKMDINDQYGFAVMANYPLCQMIYAAGLRLCEPGTFKLALNNERMITLIEKMDLLLNKSGDTYAYPYNAKAEEIMDITSGRTLFALTTVGALSSYRDSEVDFGLVPMPKMDDTQEHYECVNWAGMMCVPKIVENPEMIGKAVELLSYYSKDTTIPAYYDTLLGEKLARDDDMREMIEYIFAHVVFDGGRNYFGLNGSMQSMFYTISSLVCNQKSTDWASWYESHREACETLISDFFAAVDANE